MILRQNPETGWWTEGTDGDEGFCLSFIHDISRCGGVGPDARLCDVHNKRGEKPWSEWPLNWRDDRGIMEMIDPESGIGHPTPAQVMYWVRARGVEDKAGASVHGCDGGCQGAYRQIRQIGGGKRDGIED